MRVTSTCILALSLLILLILTSSIITVASSTEYMLLVYGSRLCPHCNNLIKYLSDTYGEDYILYYDMAINNTYRELFEKIVSILQLPPNLIAIPFTIVICNNTVTGVVVGDIEDKELWDKLISKPNTENTIPIYIGAIVNGTRTYKIAGKIALDPKQAVEFFMYGRLGGKPTLTTTSAESSSLENIVVTSTTPSRTTTITVDSNTETLRVEEQCPENEGYICPANISSGLFPQETNINLIDHATTSIPTYTPRIVSTGEEYNTWNLLFLTISLAAVDSINPCTIYLYILLLIAASVTGIALEKKITIRRVVSIGLAFILAVMVGYIILGLGLITVLSMVPKLVFTAVGVGFGSWTIYSGLTGKEKVVAKRKVVKLLPHASKSVLLSILLGLLATFTLLPCSVGPYIVFTGVVSKLPLVSAAPLLLLYNIIFVLPLVAVLVAILLGISRSKIRELIIKHNRLLSIASGILLIIVIVISVYMSLTS